MLQVELLKTTEDGQQRVGVFSLVGDTIEYEGEEWGRDILEDPVYVMRGDEEVAVEAADDPETWLRELPDDYNGSMLRAQIISE